ncbi:MAG: zf-TFIIB domain-containing protein [bacterium]
MFKQLFEEILGDIMIDLGISKPRRPDKLSCPNCEYTMKVISIKFKGKSDIDILKIDFCDSCEGIWFDRGELVKALEINIKDISKFFPSSTKRSEKGSGRRVCPICSKYLSLINYSKDSDIWVDVCTNGCGIFLDAGELELLKLYSIDPNYLKTTTTQVLVPVEKPTMANLQKLNELQSRLNNLKDTILNKLKEAEDSIKNQDISKLKQLIDNGVFRQELQELNSISSEVKQLYSMHSTDNQVVELQNSLEKIKKFIDIKLDSINQRLSSYVKQPSVVQEKVDQKQVDQKVIEKLPEKHEKVGKQEKFEKIEKIKLSGYENLHSYLIINNNLYIFSENKIYKKVQNSFEEIKLKEINFRIKRVKVVDGKIYLMGSSGNIAELNDLSQVSKIYRIGYSDINDLAKVNNKFYVLSSGRVFILDNEFKILQEKTLNASFVEVIDDKILMGYSSLFYVDENLNKVHEYQVGTYKQFKKMKQIISNQYGSEFYVWGSGILSKFTGKEIQMLNLPKSYVEINDVQFMRDEYYVCCNSGGLYATKDFSNYQEIKLNTFDNLYSIFEFEGMIYVICSGSNVMILS